MDNSINILKENRIKVTDQRILVMQILSRSESHIDAESLFERASNLDPNISLATIYRTLNTLKEANIIVARYFARDHKREYFVLSDREDRYHFTCVNCGEVSTVNTSRLRQAKKELSEELGISFTHACLCFEGYCNKCEIKSIETGKTINLSLAQSNY